MTVRAILWFAGPSFTLVLTVVLCLLLQVSSHRLLPANGPWRW